MRFEIGGGGIAIIFLGVTALSAGVYWMGMQTGYAARRQNEALAEKMTTDYALPDVPAAQSSSSAPAPGASVNPPAAIASVRAPQAVATSHATLASVEKAKIAAPKPTAPSAAPPSAEPLDHAPPSAPERFAATPPPAPLEAHRKPFNIEIQAAMDADNANQIVKRLAAIGYQPRMLPTSINGKTWYKIEVGPYTTREEAAAAEVELRRKYNSTYGAGGAPAQARDNSAADAD